MVCKRWSAKNWDVPLPLLWSRRDAFFLPVNNDHDIKQQMFGIGKWLGQWRAHLTADYHHPCKNADSRACTWNLSTRGEVRRVRNSRSSLATRWVQRQSGKCMRPHFKRLRRRRRGVKEKEEEERNSKWSTLSGHTSSLLVVFSCESKPLTS